MGKSTLNISKSFLIEYFEYRNGEACGHLLNEMYVKHSIRSKPTKATLGGHYFEEKCIGYTSGDKSKMKEQLIEVKLLTSKGKKSAELERIDQQVQIFIEQSSKLPIEIETVGEKIQYDDYKCVLDIKGKYDGRPAVIDLKLTGMFDNKWEDFGWHLDTLEDKWKLMMQAKLTKWIWMQKYEKQIDFYFWVFSKTEKLQQRLIKIDIDKESMRIFTKQLLDARQNIYESFAQGFTPYPEYNRCRDCPLKGNCEYEATIIEPVLKMI